jgi:hypothetical protein
MTIRQTRAAIRRADLPLIGGVLVGLTYWFIYLRGRRTK